LACLAPVFFVLLAATASAGELRRCVGPDGSVTWTDEPCAADARQDKVVSPEAVERQTRSGGILLRAATDKIREGELACLDGHVVRSVGGTFVNLLDADPAKSKMPCRVAAADADGREP
jgi:hypothetical protein